MTVLLYASVSIPHRAVLMSLHSTWPGGEIEEGEIYSVLFSLDGEDYDAEAQGIYL